jgi:hypothetical protein
MSNVQDGGIIVIGIVELQNKYKKIGLTDKNIATYNRDTMLDQMTKYADPHVSFSVETITDDKKYKFIVITVDPFREIPVICRSDGSNLQAGMIYYRGRNGRPKSAIVSNSYDMRDIIERAAIKLNQRFREIGIPPHKNVNNIEDLHKIDRGNL